MSFKIKSTLLLVMLAAMTVIPILPIGTDGRSMLDRLRPGGSAAKYVPNKHDTLTSAGVADDGKSLGDTLLDAVRPAPATYKVYKWKDAKGRIQLTDQPPPEGVSYKMIAMSNTTTPKSAAAPAAPVAPAAPAASASALDKTVADASQVKGLESLMDMYSPDKVQQLMESAKQVNQLAEGRQKAMEDALNQLNKGQ